MQTEARSVPPRHTSLSVDASHLSGKARKQRGVQVAFPAFFSPYFSPPLFRHPFSGQRVRQRVQAHSQHSPYSYHGPPPPPSLPRPPPLPSIYTVFFGLKRAINRPPSLLTTPSCTANSFRSPPTLPKSS